MPPGTEQEHGPYSEGGDPFVREQLSSIDGDLLADYPDDDRFSSGVPDSQRASSLDFIKMTGLTRAPERGRVAPPAEDPQDDLNTNAPLSFYEKGVSDVDDGDDGGDGGFGGLSDALLDSNLVGERASDTLHKATVSPSAEAFKDIVAGLQAHGVTDGSALERSPSADLLTMFEQVERAAAGESAEADSVDETVRGTWPETSESDVEGIAHTEPESEDVADTEPQTGVAEDGDLEADDASPPDAEVVPDAVAEPDGDGSAEDGVNAEDGVGAEEELSAEALTDDWDALIDAVSADPEPAETVPLVKSSGRSSDALAEAEQLMQALGKKHTPDSPVSAITLATAAPSSVPSLLPLYSSSSPTPVASDEDLDYDYSVTPTRRRSHRHSRNARRGWRVVKILALLAVLGVGLTAAYVYVVAPALVHVEDLSAKARGLQAEGKYEEAARTYDELAQKLGSGPAGVDAEFQAAYVLTLGEPRTGDEKSRRYRAALARLGAFVEEYPAHIKRTRALTIMGRLHYELAEYDEAITILRDRTDPLSDPQAALTMLRYLARSYSQKGDYDAAESAFLQAATLPGNYSVDRDYYSLGEMFKLQAELADSEAEKAAFIATAAAYWRRAVQVPGIDPAQKAVLQERLDWLVYQDGGEGMPALPEPAAASPTQAMDIAIPTEGMDASTEGETPAPPALVPETGTHEVDPAAEFDTIITAPVPPQPEAAGTVEANPSEEATPSGE